MEYISQQDLDYIYRKHKQKVYEENTGLSNEEIKKELESGKIIIFMLFEMLAV